MVVCLVAFCGLAFAQAPIGSIEGTLTDPSGAVVVGAKVTITELATGRILNLSTTTAGIFVARALPPGAYKVQISASGFREFVDPEVIVEAGKVVKISPQLELGPTLKL